MGCSESTEVVPDEVAKELYSLMVGREKTKFEELLHDALWHNGRTPDWEFMKRVISSNIETTSRDWKETLLHYTVRFNNLPFLELLVQYDPPLNAFNSHGNTVIHTCCIAGCSPDAFELLTKDIDPLPGPLQLPNEDGDYPIHLASRNHFGWLVESLIFKGTSTLTQNRDGDTPLDLMRNVQLRNPLSRGNVAVRKKTTRDWWVLETMDLKYIQELLEKALAGAEIVPRKRNSTAGQQPHLNNSSHCNTDSGASFAGTNGALTIETSAPFSASVSPSAN